MSSYDSKDVRIENGCPPPRYNSLISRTPTVRFIRSYTRGADAGGSKTEDYIYVITIVLLNLASIVTGAFYTIASVLPNSVVSFNLEGYTKGCYIVYIIFLLILGFIVWLFDSALVYCTKLPRWLKILLYTFLSIFVWGPFVFSPIFAAIAWHRPCVALSATIRLHAVDPCTASPGRLSTAIFPKSMGGTMQLHETDAENQLYLFAAKDSRTNVTYDLTNMTYIYHMTRDGKTTTTSGPIVDHPLSFPQLELNATAVGLEKDDFPPAVILTDPAGNVIVETGGSRYGHIAELKVCASDTYFGAVVAIGRILIQLQYVNSNEKNCFPK